MSKPSRPDAVNQVELGVQLGYQITPAALQMLTYIQNLEKHAQQLYAALAYLQSTIRNASNFSAQDRCRIIETSTLLSCGHDERTMGRAQ